MGMKLRIKQTATVMRIRRHNQIASLAIIIGSTHPYPRTCIPLSLLQGRTNRMAMGFQQPVIAADECLNRDRLGCGERQIVEGACLALNIAIQSDAVCAVTRTKKFATLRMQPSADRLKLIL